jgi:type VI secretion system protein ImpJ
MLRRLVEILEEKSTVFSREQRQPAGSFQAGLSARHVAQFWFLHAINSSLPTLRHFLLSKHVHPADLFGELSRLAGALCTFGFEVHPRDLPRYDHRDPGPSFQALDEHIRRHLEIVVPSKAITLTLHQTEDSYYHAEIGDERCLGPSRWLFAIHSPVGEAELISRVPQLVKICSAKFVPELVKRALPGLTLTHVQVPPSAIAARVESQYFAINRTGPCWEHIVQTRKAGVYVPGEFPSPQMEIVVILD